MKSHTISKNKKNKTLIITFTKEFEKALFEVHPLASSMFLDKFLSYMKTDYAVFYNYEQEKKFENFYKTYNHTFFSRHAVLCINDSLNFHVSSGFDDNFQRIEFLDWIIRKIMEGIE